MVAAESTTDWVTAIATVFAAVGTVGAVIVALRQASRQDRRSLNAQCRLAVAATDPAPLHLVTLRGTNDGPRRINVQGAYLMTDTEQQIFALFSELSEKLPQTISDGESVEISWPQSALRDVITKENGGNFIYAFFVDSQGDVYKATFPGVKARRRGLIHRRVDYEVSHDQRAELRA